MGIFKDRNKKTIAELENYYSNRQGSGMAWIMAFLSLLITVVVLAGLFFGGRWLYRTIASNDDNGNVATSSIEESPVEISIGSSEDSENSTDTTKTEGTGLGVVGVVTDEAASTDTPSSEAESSNSSQVRGTGDATEIPNTGANELIVLVPMLAAVAGYYLSRKRQLS